MLKKEQSDKLIRLAVALLQKQCSDHQHLEVGLLREAWTAAGLTEDENPLHGVLQRDFEDLLAKLSESKPDDLRTFLYEHDQLITVAGEGYNTLALTEMVTEAYLLGCNRFLPVVEELVKDIEDTGGIDRNLVDKVHPHADHDWGDLAITYLHACEALGREPLINEPGTDADPDQEAAADDFSAAMTDLVAGQEEARDLLSDDEPKEP